MFACSDDSHRMNFYEMAEKVDSKESFLRFVQALAEDAEAADAEPERTADGKLNLSPRGWENGSVSAFLGAMSAWAAGNSGITGEPMVSEQASWRAFAEILHSGKFYE
jgi:hypothetical protein